MRAATAAASETTRREVILEAALESFLHYGFRRTSLEELARAAGISRTGLYHHFRNKEEIFQAASAALYEQSLTAAERAADADQPVADRLYSVLDAKLGRFFDVLRASRHGAELTDESNRLCGDLIADSTGRYHEILARVLREADRAGEISLARAELDPDSAASLLYLSAQGLEGRGSPPTAKQFRERLAQLVRLAVAGLGGNPS